MSTRQLRSKRRTASPVNKRGDPKVPNKKPKKKDSVSVDQQDSESSSDEFVKVPNKMPKKKDSVVNPQDSESSSDEFVRPPDDLKVNVVGISKRDRASPAPDFSAIESSIFSGVARLSDSDSSDSDFEEVSNVPAAISASNTTNTKKDIVSVEETNTMTSTLLSETTGIDGAGKPMRNSKKTQNMNAGKVQPMKPSKNDHTGDSNVKSNKLVPDADTKAEGRPARISKRKPLDEPETKAKLSKSKIKDSDDIKHENGVPGKEKLATSKLRLNVKKEGNRKSKAGEEAVMTKPFKQSKSKDEKNETNLALKKEATDSVDNLDVGQLLALGEGLIMETKSSDQSDSDSDGEEWEEVDPNDVKRHEIPKEGVQITLKMPEFSWKRKKHKDQQACLQAEMNRAFNRVRRELQLLCHKTSLLLWLAHGIFLNNVINSNAVKAMALSLVPSDLTNLPKAPGKKYVDQLLKWFSKEFECSEGFPETLESTQSRPLASVLEQHFSRRYAKSCKELTFMFVTILRAVGMESRLIISFQPMPLKPQSDELLAINTKGAKSKRGRKSRKESKDDSESEDNPDPVSEKSVKSSKYFDSETSLKKMDKSVSMTNSPEKKGTYSNSKSVAKCGRKSEPTAAKSPCKTRELRGKSSKKTYEEQTDSESEGSQENAVKPILSPDRKKENNTSLTERLKAAAAKRLPASKRRSESSGVIKPSSSKSGEKSSQDSGSATDFEPKPKRNSRSGSSMPASSQKTQGSRRSRSQKSDSDSDFETKPKPKQSPKNVSSKAPPKRRQSKSKSSKGKGIGNKVLSSDDERQLTSSGSDYWAEVYLKDEERWTCVDVLSRKVDSTKDILAKASQPVCYVIAFNAEGTIKDVTKRYSPRFSQVTSKQRVSVDWWAKTLKPFRPKQTRQEAAEDNEMNLVELDRPMPKSVGECKNHPLYVLKRHLLKFEAIYPPDAPSLGFVRNEALYARQNVYTLHSREIWMKEAKVVKLGEEPYKIVKARPKYDRLSGKVITDLPLEVFGPWQVEDYVPPPAKDGKVPRNAYGNVELFKPTMLPKGTVHLQVPGLTRVAKKLRIDCAPAVVGFDYHSGGCHPTYDGFVVCEEFVDVLMDAWNQEVDESAKRREEKHEKRVYGNWRRLIKGLLIREALKHRYDFKGEGQEGPGSSQSTVNVDVLKASRITADDAPLPSLFPKLMANIRSQKPRQRKSTTGQKKSQNKSQSEKKSQRPSSARKRKDETSEEEESDFDSSSTEEDESEMVLLSDEDSGSEFEDLKKIKKK